MYWGFQSLETIRDAAFCLTFKVSPLPLPHLFLIWHHAELPTACCPSVTVPLHFLLLLLSLAEESLFMFSCVFFITDAASVCIRKHVLLHLWTSAE